MIKAFLFDYGGVITAGGNGNELPERLAKSLDITSEESYVLLSPVWSDYSKGRITEHQLWQTMERSHGKIIGAEKRNIWNTWNEHMRPRPKILSLVTKLKNDGYKVGLLSNVIPNTAEDVRAHGGYEVFDFLILSCLVGYAKPEVEIYELALKELSGTQPEEVVFVDDQERYLIPARKLGIRTIHAQNTRQIIQDVEALLKKSSKHQRQT